jgi:transglutaminase-like putative cysteine protease/tetratricopeptide (TPR) repeat protein
MSPHPPLLRFALFVLALLLGAAAQAQSSPTMRDNALAAAAFSRGDPLPAWALPFAEIPPTSRHEPVVMRVAETQIHLDEGVQYLVSRAVQVNDASELAQIGQYALYFVPQYQRIRLHSAHILRDGRVLDRSGAFSVRFLERESGLENGIYSGMVTAVLLFDDVRVGDTLHLVYTLEGRNPVLGPRYSHTVNWDHAEPVELRRATLIAPAGRRIAWRMQGDYRRRGVEPQDISPHDGHTRILRFEERAIDGLDDEPGVPEDFFSARFLQLTEFADWHEVAQWATGLFPPGAELPPELQPLVERWRALPTPEERAAAALRYVQEEIRYFSVSMGESSHRPYPPAQVVLRRYGDCKDKSYLLVTLLRALGIQADPVLVALTAPRTPTRLLPNPDVFDHVVAQVRIGSQAYYLDGTRLGQRGRLDRLGTLEGSSGLVVRADTQALVTMQSSDPPALATTDLSEHFTVPALGASGRLAMRQQWNGSTAEMMRLAYQRMTPEQRRKQLQGLYERRYPGIRLAGEPTLADDTEANSFTVRAEFEVPELTKDYDGDWALRYFPDNVAGVIKLPESFHRNFPVAIATLPYRARYHLEVHWPEEVSVMREPSSTHVASDFFRADIQRSFRGNLSTLDLQYAPRVASVQPQQLAKLQQDLKALERGIAGAVVVDSGAIKHERLFGLVKTSLRDALDARLQRQIERNTIAIDGEQLSGDDLAEALCDRAEALAERGRVDDGLSDARNAVAAAPVSGRAHQCRANLLFAHGDFAAAVPDYTKALTLGQEAGGVLYRRGHARFYAGQYEAAAQDFGKAAALRSASGNEGDAAHAQLWQAWALQRAGLAWPTTIAASARAQGPWPEPALAMLVGTLTPEQLLAQIARSERGDAREAELAEAWFHLGQHFRMQGDNAKARDAFEKARAKGITTSVEHTAAGFELAGSGARSAH